MASNEIELTFIRCPSCKSLMPSTAHKCGMCGLNMDSEEEVQPERKLRLRQRSMTNVEELFEEKEEIVAPTYSEPSIQFNPEDSSIVENKVIETAPRSPFTTRVREDYEDETDEDSELIEENGADDIEDDNVVETFHGADSVGEEPLKRKRRRRRKKKKPSPLVVSEAISEEVVPQEVEVSFEEVVPQEVEVSFEEDEILEEEKTTYESLSSVAVSVEKLESPIPVEEPPIEFTKVQEVSKINNQIERNEEMNSNNKLLGWFVNYSTEQSGKSYEIREGKKFIGRQQLRPHDLLIPDSAISTPHCLLNAERGKLSLQDLMSEQGTFLKQSGETEFKKIDSTVQLKHGDILKLGSFELIVCLIPV